MAWTQAARDAAALARELRTPKTTGSKTSKPSRQKLTIQKASAALRKLGYQLTVNQYDLKSNKASYNVTGKNGKPVKMTAAMVELMVKRKLNRR